MTNNIKPTFLKIFTLAAALLGILLRFLLYATAVDQKGLITDSHWAAWGLFSLTLLFLAGLLITARNPKKEMSYEESFTPSFIRGCGSLAATTGILLHCLLNMDISDSLNKITTLFGALSCIGLFIVAICRFLGTKPNFLCHSTASIFFALQTVVQYRNWSADPQLMDYGFYLLAMLSLMLSAYFLAQFHVEPKSHRPLWVTAMAAVFFCLVAIPESGDTTFLLSCGIWAFTCTPQMATKHRRQRPAMEQLNEEE